MPDHLTIPKEISSFPPFLDWSLLRETGIKHIENLGSDLWTDYNVHDPGITILEVLCYALTDLGYRTHFDIRDLLTRSREEKENEPKTIFNKPFDDNFFTAAEVLSCNPVTLNDFRKLLIDIPGVRNAWLEKAPEGEMPICLHRKEKKLQFGTAEKDPEFLDPLCISGLYDICVELEPLLVRDACGSVFFSKEGILQKVHKKLNAYRNLCEDIREVIAFGEEQIAVCADIELQASANPGDVLLEMYKQLEEFLSPSLRFYTLQEMLQKGKRVEDIFEGRPLTAESHGFIDPDDLKKMDPVRKLYASDFYRVIMDVKGVLAVRNLSLANAIDGVALTKGEKWCLELTPKYRPHFDLDRSQITFYKGVLPFNVSKTITQQRYLEEKAASVKAFLDPYQLDLPIPEGTHHNLEDYQSIVEDFPLTYGIGEDGLKGVPDARRKGQAKQMKGYLLFFDQLLANYLAQLAHVRDLFSMRPDEQRNGRSHTYFTHLLSEVPGITDLVKNFKECTGNDEDDLPPEDFPSYLQYIAESIETYQERRNRFLDHMLARFSESFTDYVLLMFEINGRQQDPASLIQDKADFLQSYPETSRNRGKGYDYSHPPDCESAPGCGDKPAAPEAGGTAASNDRLANVSGLEKRVSKLIGIDQAGWRNLAHGNITGKKEGWGFSIDKDGEEVLISKTLWETEDQACAALQEWWGRYICEEGHYRRLTYDVAGEKEYAISILNDQGEKIATGLTRYPFLARYCQAIDDLFPDGDNLPLENIETEETAQGVFYLVKSPDGTEIYRFMLAGEPPQDLSVYFLFFKNRKFYCREDYTVPQNNEYGFFLTDDQEACIAVCPRRYVDPEKREEVIHWLISQVKLPGFKCTAVRETECFDFQLFNYNGATLLFESAKGFKSSKDAGLFFDTPDNEEDVLGWAVLEDHYARTSDEAGMHSFCLKGTDETCIALHPHLYVTEQERDDRLQAIIYYLDDAPPISGVEGTPGTFEFEIVDAAGEILFKSVNQYPTQAGANKAAWLVRLLARHRTYYRLLDEEEGEHPYRFELLDRNEDPLAIHPRSYATDCERDLAMDVIIYCSENVDTRNQFIEKEDGFYYDLLDLQDKPLMNGTVAYPDAGTAAEGWDLFLDRAVNKDHFRLTQHEELDYPFGFELLDAEGSVIATSALTYETEAESKMALRAVLNYVCHTEWLVNITGDPGAYDFWLDGKDERRLLDSVEVYPDEPTARYALLRALELARDVQNFYLLENFGLELRDENGQTVASHPQEYNSESEREAAINLIVNYVRNDDPVTATPNTGGAFQAVIFGEHGEVIFKGVHILQNKEQAAEDLTQLLAFAACPGNYQPFEDGTENCRYGFRLLDEEGDPVAIHALPYPSVAERDKAMFAAFAWLTNAQVLVDKVIREKEGKYCFVLEDFSGKALLKGSDEYNTVGDARDKWLLVSELICDTSGIEITYDNPNCRYSVRIKEGTITLAEGPGFFDSRTQVNEWIELIQRLLAEQPVQGTETGTECGYYFSMGYTCSNDGSEDEDRQVLLQGTAHFPVPSLALQACHEAAPLLREEAQYQLIPVGEKWQMVLLAENGDTMAAFVEDDGAVRYYESETEAHADRDCLINALPSKDALPDVCEQSAAVKTVYQESKSHCRLENKEEVYLESISGQFIPTFTDSRALFFSRSERNLTMDELLSSFQKDTGVDIVRTSIGDTNYWEIKVDDFRFLGKLEEDSFSNDNEIKNYLRTLGSLRENYRLIDSEENCRYSFELIDGAIEKGICEHCNRIHELAQQPDRYSLITNEEECLYGFELTDYEGIPVAGHPVFYTSVTARDEAIARVIAKTNCEGMHLVEHILLRPKQMGREQVYGFELIDAVLKIPVLKSAATFENEEDALTAFRQVRISLHEYDPDHPDDPGHPVKITTVEMEDHGDGSGEEEKYGYSFEIYKKTADGSRSELLAMPDGPCCTRDEIEEQLQKLSALSVEEDPDAPEGDLPALPEPYQVSVKGVYLSDELVGDKLMKPVLDYLEPGTLPTAVQSDPYSFRATVVLPYWPQRFQRPEFRAFLETTLRKEAPAHIFLRICWVDVCQMRAFEQAYCSWMATQAGGEDNCDAAVAKNKLIDVLCQLRNIYPAASLHDCNQPTKDTNRIILNYSIIGSANSSSHGK